MQERRISYVRTFVSATGTTDPQFLQPDYEAHDQPSPEEAAKAVTAFQGTVTKTLFSLGELQDPYSADDLEAEFKVPLAGGEKVRGAVKRYNNPNLYSHDAKGRANPSYFDRSVSLELPQSGGNPPQAVRLWSNTEEAVMHVRLWLLWLLWALAWVSGLG